MPILWILNGNFTVNKKFVHDCIYLFIYLFNITELMREFEKKKFKWDTNSFQLHCYGNPNKDKNIFEELNVLKRF